MRNRMLAAAAAALALAAPAAAQSAPEAQTTGTTPITLGSGPSVPAEAVCRIQFYVFASDHAGDVATWHWVVSVYRVGSSPAVIAAGTPTVRKTAGATAWTATLGIVSDVYVNATVTGALATTIDWKQTYDGLSEGLNCMEGFYLP